MELNAFNVDDRSTSYQDLVASIRRAGTADALSEGIDADNGSELAQRIADRAMVEIEARRVSCADTYPFDISDQVLSVKESYPRTTPGLRQDRSVQPNYHGRCRCRPTATTPVNTRRP